MKKAGFELSYFCIAGLGGRTKSEQNARNTARVLNEINPDFIRIRRYVPRKDSPLFEESQKGEFQQLSPYEELREIQMLIKNLNVTSRVCFDHYINPAYKTELGYVWLFKQDHDGYKFPEEKDLVLKLIERGLKVDETFYTRAEELMENFV